MRLNERETEIESRSSGKKEGGMQSVANGKKLTEKQMAFCRFCAEGLPPAQAWKKAGYANRNDWKETIKQEKILACIERMKSGEKDDGTVAEKKEILSFLTDLMRDEEGTDTKTRMKAAELLGKRVSLFEKESGKEEESRIVIVDDIP